MELIEENGADGIGGWWRTASHRCAVVVLAMVAVAAPAAPTGGSEGEGGERRVFVRLLPVGQAPPSRIVSGGPGDPNVIEADVAAELIPPREIYLDGVEGERIAVRLSLGQLSTPWEAVVREGRLLIHRDLGDGDEGSGSRPWHLAEVGEACDQLLVILAAGGGGEGWTRPVFLVLAHDTNSVGAGSVMGVNLSGHPIELEVGQHKMDLMPGRAGVSESQGVGLVTVRAAAWVDGRRVAVAHRASSLGAGERLLLVAYPQEKLGGGKPVRLLGFEDRAVAREEGVASQ